MRSSKAAVAADLNKARARVGNLETALTTMKKEKEDKAAQHKASHFTFVCRAKQGCRKTVVADICESMPCACVLLCVTRACMCCTPLPCLLRYLNTNDRISKCFDLLTIRPVCVTGPGEQHQGGALPAEGQAGSPLREVHQAQAQVQGCQEEGPPPSNPWLPHPH